MNHVIEKNLFFEEYIRLVPVSMYVIFLLNAIDMKVQIDLMFLLQTYLLDLSLVFYNQKVWEEYNIWIFFNYMISTTLILKCNFEFPNHTDNFYCF